MTAVLVVGIAADGIWRGLDTNFPALYRHTASLGIAISKVHYHTSGFIGLQDVADVLIKGGLSLVPSDVTRFTHLAHNPDEANRILQSATNIPILDRTKTFVLNNNETGTIDYYALALKLFGYRIDGFYWLFIALVSLVAACFLVSFHARPIFIIPCVFWLLLLMVAVHEIDPNDLRNGTPTNARFLPMLSLFPLIYVLTLAANARSFSLTDALTTAVAAIVFGLCLNARAFVYWQLFALVLIVICIFAARFLSSSRTPYLLHLGRYTLRPLVIFIAIVGLFVVFHQWRKDSTAYWASTRIGHPYWLSYLSATLEPFKWRIADLQARSGVVIGDNTDAYVGALIRIKITDRGERFEYYQDANNGWINAKRETLAREIVFDLWRQYPLHMLDMQGRALASAAALVFSKVDWLLISAIAFFLTPSIRYPWGWIAWGVIQSLAGRGGASGGCQCGVICIARYGAEVPTVCFDKIIAISLYSRALSSSACVGDACGSHRYD